MITNEGVIKFRCKLIDASPPPYELIKDLNDWRTRLFGLNYIGKYSNGIGYGNVSIRTIGNQFIITGTQTGCLPVLTSEHYALVTGFNIQDNYVECSGKVKASSESLTHAMIYSLMPEINSVFHIHSGEFWKKLLNKIPTTKKEVEYGTPEMALEIKRLLDETNLRDKKIFVMAGHEEGLVSFGISPEEAGRVIWECCC